MLKTPFAALAASLLIWTSEPAVSIAEELNVNKCIDAFAVSLRSVKSYDVHIETREVRDGERPEDRVVPAATIEHSRQVFDSDGRYRYERFDAQRGATATVQVCDGKKVVTLSPDRLMAWVNAPQSRRGFPFEKPTANYEATFRQLLDETEITELLRRRSCRAFRSDGAVMIECLPDPRCNQFPKAGWRFFFVQKQQMLPHRIEYYHMTMKQPRLITEVLEFYKVDESLWMPGRVQHTVYSPSGRKLQRFEVRVDGEKSNWNKGLPDKLFRVDIPVGTRVIRDGKRKGTPFPAIDPREAA